MFISPPPFSTGIPELLVISKVKRKYFKIHTETSKTGTFALRFAIGNPEHQAADIIYDGSHFDNLVELPPFVFPKTKKKFSQK